MKTREEKIEKLERLIDQGEELADQGYPTDLLNNINRKLLERLLMEDDERGDE